MHSVYVAYPLSTFFNCIFFTCSFALSCLPGRLTEDLDATHDEILMAHLHNTMDLIRNEVTNKDGRDSWGTLYIL